ncbi:hypothetical protein LZQ00_05570 [Sphingobacterium sp. SRCM116780]|uniref:hypothetical protein n=1 Tax=Sphingobacterium sp. SRCM116780 TaxID=2907623 RepID=UPI001F3C150D|nr:hypothetical protein [Sphingobacterium sp. SRCM116780]UIR57283.1 hypothetical protein LZQ00_05570 [Sphingobacterium sp. SRCM116780]
MSVKRKVLEQKSNAELEEYIKSESQFVPEAIAFAYDILKSRGRDFTEEESIHLENILAKRYKEDEIIIHSNHIKSSNCMFISAALGVINILLTPAILTSASSISAALLTLAFLVGIGLLIRKGTDWIKYVLLILLVIGLLGIPYMIQNILQSPIVGVINIIQTILQIIALILLFTIPKIDNKEWMNESRS